MTNPRLPILGPAEATAAAEKIGIDPKYLTQPIWGMLLARPKLAKLIYDLLTDLLFRGRLDPRLRELVIMRVAWATDAEFEWAQHWQIARNAGVDTDDILGVRDWGASERYNPADRAALAAVDDVVATGTITDGTWSDLARQFAEPELLELTAAIATWHFISVLARSLAVPLDDGMESWPPDGVAPTG